MERRCSMPNLESQFISLMTVIRNSLRMEDAHFRADLSRTEAMRVFSKHVELVEVETTSYCNRTCAFCPNSFIDRLSEKRIMPEITWKTIVQNLRDIDYSGSFVWSR